MYSDYLDKLIKYMSLKSSECHKGNNAKYLSLNNLRTPRIVFTYKVYQNKEGIEYSANIYYWYYLLLTVL
jgi:hypothetical protein